MFGCAPGISNAVRSRVVIVIKLQKVTVRHQCIGEGKGRILLDCSSKVVDCFFKSFFGSRIPEVKTHQIFVVGFCVRRVMLCQVLPLVGTQIKCKRIGDTVGNRVLNTEDVSKGLVEFLRPERVAVRDVHELHSSANPVARSLNRSTQDRINA